MSQRRKNKKNGADKKALAGAVSTAPSKSAEKPSTKPASSERYAASKPSSPPTKDQTSSKSPPPTKAAPKPPTVAKASSPPQSPTVRTPASEGPPPSLRAIATPSITEKRGAPRQLTPPATETSASMTPPPSNRLPGFPEPPSSPPPAPKNAPIPPPPLSSDDVRAQIKSIESDIDRELERASQPRLPEDMPIPSPSSVLMTEAEGVFATARELLSTDYYLRRWGKLAMRNRSEEVDDFGFDPVYEGKLKAVFDFLYDRYFRVEASGLEHIPDQGRCLLIANHSGTLPADGLMIKLAVKREHPSPRDVRWLAEDFLFHFPFLGSISNRIGAVRACQENAERLLRQEALVAVFPEGVKGIGKLYKDRYRLQRFGRGGFIKLALRMRAPIVPVGIIGGEETNPLLYRLDALGKAFGFPYIPITPTFPLLGPVGLAPLPTKWRVVFGPRLEFSEYDADAADDEVLVSRLTERVRASIQELVDGALGSRTSIWFG